MRTHGTVWASADGRGARDVPRLAEARVDGGLRAPAWTARARRWVRIWSITDAWVMHAMIRIGPRHVGHASGSTSTICCNRAAQRWTASVGASRGAGTMAGGPSAVAGAAFPRMAAGAGGKLIARRVPHRNARPESGSGTVQRSPARRKLDLKTVIPTHLPERVPMEREVLAGTGGGFAVRGAGVHRAARMR